MTESHSRDRSDRRRRALKRRPVLEDLEGRRLLATRIFLSNAGPITPFESTEYRGPIAKFTATDDRTGKPITDPLRFGGEVRWGDGTSSKIGDMRSFSGAWVEWVKRGNTGYFNVMGRKTWDGENPNVRMSVQVTTMDGSANTTINASVRDAPKSITGQTVTMGPGLWHIDAPVARIRDTNPKSDINEFKAFIRYTDPVTRQTREVRGSIVSYMNEYIVYAPRVWGRAGTYNLSVRVEEVGGITKNTSAVVREL